MASMATWCAAAEAGGTTRVKVALIRNRSVKFHAEPSSRSQALGNLNVQFKAVILLIR
jgi:hypothetical protein